MANQVPIGIKESSELLSFLSRFVTVIGDVTADGRVSLIELFKFVDLWSVIAPAVENYKGALPEIADLDDVERAQLKSVFAESLKLPNGITEQLFEEGSDLALHIVQFIVKIRDTRKGAL